MKDSSYKEKLSSFKTGKETLAEFDSTNMSLRLHEIKDNRNEKENPFINYLSIEMRNASRKEEVSKPKEQKFIPSAPIPPISKQNLEKREKIDQSESNENELRKEVQRLTTLCYNYQENNYKLVEECELNILEFEEQMVELEKELKHKEQEIENLKKVLERFEQKEESEKDKDKENLRKIENIEKEKEFLLSEYKKLEISSMKFKNSVSETYENELSNLCNTLKKENMTLKQKLEKEINNNDRLREKIQYEKNTIREKNEIIINLEQEMEFKNRKFTFSEIHKNENSQLKTQRILENEIVYLKEHILSLEMNQCCVTNIRKEESRSKVDDKIIEMFKKKDQYILELEKEVRVLERCNQEFKLQLNLQNNNKKQRKNYHHNYENAISMHLYKSSKNYQNLSRHHIKHYEDKFQNSSSEECDRERSPITDYISESSVINHINNHSKALKKLEMEVRRITHKTEAEETDEVVESVCEKFIEPTEKKQIKTQLSNAKKIKVQSTIQNNISEHESTAYKKERNNFQPHNKFYNNSYINDLASVKSQELQ